MKALSHVLVLALFVGFATTSLYCSDEGKQAPDFSLKTGDGKTVELKKLSGKVVVVNFWATWCPPCRAEIPGMIDVYEKYRKQGLEIVGISLDREGWSVITPFVQKMKMPYPVVLGDKSVAAAYGGIQAIPTTFIIDRAGAVVKKHVGYLSKEDFESTVKPLL
jgi:cytochrome c biogenesis protein CcmG/thiol:disulfide interchange protein DsbE